MNAQNKVIGFKKKLYYAYKQFHFLKYRNKISSATKMENNIYIFGDSRGGSTFLTELFLDGERCVLWEPLMPLAIEHIQKKFYHELGNIPYIDPEANWQESIDFFTNLFNGRIISSSMINFDLPDVNYKNPSSCVLKFCRGNALLPWLTNHFPIKPIYLLRHPLAVVSSQLRHSSFQGYRVHANVKEYQKGRHLQLFERHMENIKDIKSVEEMFTVWWCLKNYDAIFANERRWLIVSYEYLLNNPVSEKKRIEEYIEVKFAEEFIEKFKRPSSTTVAGSNILNRDDQLLTWKKHLNKNQIRIIMDTVERFGFTMFSESPQPDYGQLGY